MHNDILLYNFANSRTVFWAV